MFVKTLALCLALGIVTPWTYHNVKLAMQPTLVKAPVKVWSGKLSVPKPKPVMRKRKVVVSSATKAMVISAKDQSDLHALILNKTASRSGR